MRLASVVAATGKELRELRKFVPTMAASFGLQRIDALVRTRLPGGARFAELVGFVREGTLKAYGPDGEDYDMFRYGGLDE